MSTQPIHVVQWVSYKKYCIAAYLLSNGCTGVFFNDSTKIIINPTSEIFEYTQRNDDDGKRQDTV